MKRRVADIVDYIIKSVVDAENIELLEKRLIDDLKYKGYRSSEIQEAFSIIEAISSADPVPKRAFSYRRVLHYRESRYLDGKMYSLLTKLRMMGYMSVWEFENILNKIISRPPGEMKISDVINIVTKYGNDRFDLTKEEYRMLLSEDKLIHVN